MGKKTGLVSHLLSSATPVTAGHVGKKVSVAWVFVTLFLHLSACIFQRYSHIFDPVLFKRRFSLKKNFLTRFTCLFESVWGKLGAILSKCHFLSI
jgi:hypothetical protein